MFMNNSSSDSNIIPSFEKSDRSNSQFMFTNKKSKGNQAVAATAVDGSAVKLSMSSSNNNWPGLRGLLSP